MGLVIGIIAGLFGVGLLLVPLLIDIYQARKKDNDKYKRYLEGSVGLIVIAMIFMLGGLALVGFSSGKGLAESAAGGFGGGGKKGGSEGEENNNALLTYLLLKDKGEGAESAETAEGAEAAEAAEGGEAAEVAEEAAEFAV